MKEERREESYLFKNNTYIDRLDDGMVNWNLDEISSVRHVGSQR